MNATNEMTHEIEGRKLTLRRTFDAPRELVFEAFSRCEHLKHWWGPKGWSLPVCEMDFRPGGKWFYCMGGPDGEQSCGLMTYHEIEAPQRIVATDAFTDGEGNINEEMPQILETILFTAENGKTLVTNHSEYASEADLNTVLELGMLEGIAQTFDRLEAHLAQLAAQNQ